MDSLLNLIRKVLASSNAITFIGFFITILVAFITSFLTAKNARDKTTTDFFKQQGIEKQEHLLTFWSTVLLDNFEKAVSVYAENNKLPKKSEQVEILKHMQLNCYMYLNSSSLRAISTYMQCIYRNKSNSSEKLLALIASIIKRMKYDFTGEKVETLSIIYMKINDITFKKNFFLTYYLTIYYIKENLDKILVILTLLALSFVALNKI